ncbi:bifunctional uridylyltransferase/uridylyl-removi ng enzyme [Mycolicibacterium canariasense]|uniref:Bifunctional uridylyltransferase/uridylyl-removi ng enzyme n=1 Tax=Mycolicibacterium canariasense TaxID=228230 RepID=A0A100WC68_MYCCR|nr:hypothetical protein [Mycolicibacterium canariasense]MCV7209039.1 hypothetical protein [Mycolicibacterium canariasense]ORV06087.1 hypothetical protein AWB94_19645 [Mycolicibacterium canariasense]GAS95440.1 bifunctional uridylyltransferase/uridylyl-removi ng enzyme [Mycolicibacterium canariasense]
MTDLLEVSGPASLAALVSALAPEHPRPLGSIAGFWLDGEAVFAVAQFDAFDDWPFLISIRCTSLGHDGDVRRQAKRLHNQLRAAGWMVRYAGVDTRAIA